MSHTDAPNSILSAEDLLAKMRAGTRTTQEIRLRDLIIPVRILSLDEMNQIRRGAILEAAKMQGDNVDRDCLVQKYTLKLASNLVGGSGSIPFLGDKVLSLLSVDEINFLYEEYIRVTESVNPSLETIEPEVFRELVDSLKKKSTTSRDLSLLQLRAMCTAYVDLIERLEHQASQAGN